MDRGAALAQLLSHTTVDERVLAAIARVPRELFVASRDRERAYDNTALAIGRGQTISQPQIVARMCELLELTPADRVLDIGTGSGYHAAVLAQLVERVDSVELDTELARDARLRLAAAGVQNVELHIGDGAGGPICEGPFDAINVAAAARGVPPPALEAKLADGGRLVVPVARRARQRLVLVRRTPTGLERTALDHVRFVPLRGAGARFARASS